MRKVMVFGAFDRIHPGHLHFLREAKKEGNFLVVVVGRDRTIRRLKGRAPSKNEDKRLKDIAALDHVDKALLGDFEDRYKVVVEERPDVICLGHDQISSEELKKELEKRRIKAEIHRIKAYRRDIYRSSRQKAI